MESFKKMVVVPEASYSSLINQQKFAPGNELITRLSHLDANMQQIVSNTSMAPDQKLAMYMDALRRFSAARNVQLNTPTPVQIMSPAGVAPAAAGTAGPVATGAPVPTAAMPAPVPMPTSGTQTEVAPVFTFQGPTGREVAPSFSPGSAAAISRRINTRGRIAKAVGRPPKAKRARERDSGDEDEFYDATADQPGTSNNPFALAQRPIRKSSRSTHPINRFDPQRGTGKKFRVNLWKHL